IRTDGGADLADQLLVDAFDTDFGLIGDGDFDAVGDVVNNRVRIAQRQVELFALQGGFETDALNLQVFNEAFRGAFDHPGNDRADGAIHRPGKARVLARGDSQFTVSDLNLDDGREGPGDF